ncbi:uncharacterized protein LOC131149069 [Malania oleifera]|uniref:uncharacterized protein LOC131149069 n=1 Tax=Malania oleifera TaxID=397392 RepID=UPI0025AE2F68|nr:uncharacterized protein LOC131149069 [Malania oleifera]
MVGFVFDPSNEEHDQPPKLKSSNDPLNPSVFEIDDFSSSLADSFLDFDPIEDLLEEFPDLNKIGSEKFDLGAFEKHFEMNGKEMTAIEGCVQDQASRAVLVEEGSCTESGFQGPVVTETLPKVKIEEGLCRESNAFGGLSCMVQMKDGLPVEGQTLSGSSSGCGKESCLEGLIVDGSDKLRKLDCPTEEEMGKISLVEASDDFVAVYGDGMNDKEMTAIERCVQDQAIDVTGRAAIMEDGSCTESGFLGPVVSETLPKVKIEEGLCRESYAEDPTFGGLSCMVQMKDGFHGESLVEGQTLSGSSSGCGKESCLEGLIVDGSDKLQKVDCPTEEEMGKISLAEASDDFVAVHGDGMKRGEILGGNDANKSNSESEDSSSSPLSSSSSSSSGGGDYDGEEGVVSMKREVIMEGDVEEGEIRDSEVEEMVEWSEEDEADVDDGGGGGNIMRGPLMYKNELKVLPPVPPVKVTLQPHHQTLPVGVVLSIIGAQVIVEGVEKHNPLNEGSILWITETRSPLGLVDEIFGPVKHPYYVVRYNSENKVPCGIHEGTSISFVSEFVNHVLHDSNLYKKGYDASGENDEEVSDLEFSDDEKEAEYRRALKMTKRDLNDKKLGKQNKNRKKVKNRGGAREQSQSLVPEQAAYMNQLPPNQNQHHAAAVSAPLNQGNCSRSIGSMGPTFSGGMGSIPSFPELTQASGFTAPNGFWANESSYQQQTTVFHNGSLPCNMVFSQHNQHPNQVPLLNRMPFQRPFEQTVPNVFLQYVQPNFLVGSVNAPCPGFVGESGFNNTPIGIGQHNQHAQRPTPIGIGQHGQHAQTPTPIGIGIGQHDQHAQRPTPIGIGQHGQHAQTPTPIGIGQHGQHAQMPTPIGIGQHGQNAQTLTPIGIGLHGQLAQPIGIGLQGQLAQPPMPFGMGLHGQLAQPPANAGEPGILSNRLNMEHSSSQLPPAVIQGNIQGSQKFNVGAASGKKPYGRGGRCFQSGRVRQQSK